MSELDVDRLARAIHASMGKATDHTGPVCPACRQDAAAYAAEYAIVVVLGPAHRASGREDMDTPLDAEPKATVKPYYQDDLVTIYHGDCREWMPDVDLIVTDPPYGIGVVHANGKTGGRGLAENRVYIPVHGDDEPMDVAWLIARPGRKVIFGADHFEHPVGRLLIWDKRDGLASNNFADAEVAWDSEPGAARLYRHRQMGMIGDGLGETKRLHPTQKPEAVMRWVLGLLPTGTILDPFMGSGSTLVAAKSLGRRSIGIEIEERYCDIAAQRCSQEVLGLSFLPTSDVRSAVAGTSEDAA